MSEPAAEPEVGMKTHVVLSRTFRIDRVRTPNSEERECVERGTERHRLARNAHVESA